MSVVSLLLRPFYTGLCRHICKCPIPIIVPQKIRVQSVVGYINIEIPVIVIVPPVHPPPAHILKGNGSRFCTDIDKCPVAVIVEQAVGQTPRPIYSRQEGFFIICHVYIDKSVIIIVSPCRCLCGIGIRVFYSGCGDVHKYPIPVIPPKSIESPWTGCKGVEVKITVVIKISPYPPIGARGGGNSCTTGYVGKGVVAIILEQDGAIQQDVFISIIVVIAPCNP